MDNPKITLSIANNNKNGLGSSYMSTGNLWNGMKPQTCHNIFALLFSFSGSSHPAVHMSK